MSSISVSDYRRACGDLLDDALLRPRTYFRSLEELEAIMRGHRTAFEQLGLIAGVESFHACFSDWIRDNTGTSASAGWAYAIEELASKRCDDPEEVFSEVLRSFLAQWNI